MRSPVNVLMAQLFSLMSALCVHDIVVYNDQRTVTYIAVAVTAITAINYAVRSQ